MNIFQRIRKWWYRKQIKQLTTVIQQANQTKQSNSDENVLQAQDLQQQVKEQAWFTRANNLVAEFAYEPTPVYAGINDDEPMGYLDADGKIIRKTDISNPIEQAHRGYWIKAQNKAELEMIIRNINMAFAGEIDVKYLERFLTVEKHQQLIRDNAAGDQLSLDDVELLKNDPNYAKPNLTDKKTIDYIIGIDPYK